jgi:septal ring factor EnvC (AmiA/AmiB activator)
MLGSFLPSISSIEELQKINEFLKLISTNKGLEDVLEQIKEAQEEINAQKQIAKSQFDINAREKEDNDKAAAANASDRKIIDKTFAEIKERQDFLQTFGNKLDAKDKELTSRESNLEATIKSLAATTAINEEKAAAAIKMVEEKTAEAEAIIAEYQNLINRVKGAVLDGNKA